MQPDGLDRLPQRGAVVDAATTIRHEDFFGYYQRISGSAGWACQAKRAYSRSWIDPPSWPTSGPKRGSAFDQRELGQPRDALMGAGDDQKPLRVAEQRVFDARGRHEVRVFEAAPGPRQGAPELE